MSKKAPETLAAILNDTSGSMLDSINKQYRGKIDDYDFLVLVQSCKKIMEISTKIMTDEVCQRSI